MERRQALSRNSQFTRSALAVVVVVVVLGGVLAVLLRGQILAAAAQRAAAEQMRAGAFLNAEQWLAWAVWFDPANGATDLMRAACFRRLGQQQRWDSAMKSANGKRVSRRLFDRESHLGKIHFGAPVDQHEQAWRSLAEAGLSPDEIAAAFVHGYLVLEQPEKAKNVLDQWMANDPEGVHAACMSGVYWRSQGEHARAESEFRRAATIQPGCQAASMLLAELLEDQFRLDEALGQWVELATRSDGSDVAVLGVARVLRQLGYLDEARANMDWLASRSESPPGFAAEMGHIESECGNYREAQRWFGQAGVEQSGEVLLSQAIAFALDGQPIRANQYIAQGEHFDMQSRRSYDLRVRLAVNPYDENAAAELERLNYSPDIASLQVGGYAGTQAANSSPQSDAAAALYTLHCAACHGATGDGDGRAAHHLHPRPRDFRNGGFHLANTRNGVPTLDDIESVLVRGMPGTSMPSFEDLSPDQRLSLAQTVLEFRREGVRERLVRAARLEGEVINPDELDEIVKRLTTPGDFVQTPTIGPADANALARGKQVYFKFACEACHGEDGSGRGAVPLWDDSGQPSVPRDLVSEPLKGGNEPESIYIRILLGMPASAHPASPTTPREQLIDLVHYCRSLSREPKTSSTNHQRALQAMRRAGAPENAAAP